MSMKLSLQRRGMRLGALFGAIIRTRACVSGILMGAEIAFALGIAVATVTPASAQFFPFFGSPEPRSQPQRQAPVQRPRSQGLFPWFNAPQEQVPEPQPQRRQAAPARDSEEAYKAPPPKKADSETSSTSRIVVFGDSMADWLSYGLEEAFSETPEIGIVRKVRAYSGLLRYAGRSDQDWAQVARENLAELKPSVIVILIGLGDRQAIRTSEPNAQGRPTSRTLEFRAEHWDEAYGKKVDDMIAVLKSKGVPVVWVSVPAVRGTRSTSDFSYLNDIFRQHAEKAGIAFVDVWDGFVDESGRFIAQGADVDGQIRRLRTGDGVHFTQAGARKLAHYVEREIRRLISTTPQTPVALSKGDDGAPALQSGGGAVPVRPVFGPVLPLTATSGGGDELLGGRGARPPSENTLASRVLIRGEPLSPTKGRADDFGWHDDAAMPVASVPGQEHDAALSTATADKPAPAEAGTRAVSAPAKSAKDSAAKNNDAKDHSARKSDDAPRKPAVHRANTDEARERVPPDAKPAPRRTVRTAPPERDPPRSRRFDDFFDIFR